MACQEPEHVWVGRQRYSPFWPFFLSFQRRVKLGDGPHPAIEFKLHFPLIGLSSEAVQEFPQKLQIGGQPVWINEGVNDPCILPKNTSIRLLPGSINRGKCRGALANSCE